jgi:hypothetical protein
MQAQGFGLGEKEGRHSRRIIFRRATVLTVVRPNTIFDTYDTVHAVCCATQPRSGQVGPSLTWCMNQDNEWAVFGVDSVCPTVNPLLNLDESPLPWVHRGDFHD